MSKKLALKFLKEAIVAVTAGGDLVDLKYKTKAGGEIRFWKDKAKAK